MDAVKKSVTVLLTFTMAAFCTACTSKTNPPASGTAAQNEREDYYIFDLNEGITRTAVAYTNRYGITLSGDLYTARDLDTSQSYPALVIGPPYGGVKEQAPGVYANELAGRGFVVLAFDPSFNGESGGEPRHVSSPDIFTEDFSAGVDFLGTLPYVNREKIGAVGICGSGGFVLSAAQTDTRIKAVATASLVDISSAGAGLDTASWSAMADSYSQQRWADVDSGVPQYIPTFPEETADSIPVGMEGMDAEFYSFYGLKRGHHPRARANFTTTSSGAFMNYQLLNHVDMISPRPVLLIAGEKAMTRPLSEAVFEAAGNAKEFYVVPDANHVDLYDDTSKIPFDKLEEFFKENI